MMDMNVVRSGHGVTRLAKALPRTSNYIAAQVGEEYAAFIRDRFLSGQRLRSRSRGRQYRSGPGKTRPGGLTRESVKFFKERRGVFGVRPGVGVNGRLNYLLRFERGTARSFMKPSWRAFRASGRHRQIASKTVAEIMRKSRV